MLRMLPKSRLGRLTVVCSGSVLATFSLTALIATLIENQAERKELEAQSTKGDLSVTHSLPRSYDVNAIHSYWTNRPVTTAMRLVQITNELLPLASSILYDAKISKRLYHVEDDLNGSKATISAADKHMRETVSSAHRKHLRGEDLQKWYAQELRQRLTRLGPAFVKMGQQLSIRPDLIPATVINELNKLCDSVDPVADSVAFEAIEKELQQPIQNLFKDIELVASASLGQVYRAKLRKQTNRKRTGEEDELVAIKVQRPDMIRSVSLDLFLLHHFAVAYDALITRLTHQSAYHEGLVDAFARGSYQELDYEKEAENQTFFQKEFRKRKCAIHIPNVYDEYTTRGVLTSEWVEGTKLADAPPEVIQSLIPVGVELFLTQLLDIGMFHADPHPGNLCVRNSDHQLVLLDFGLCATIDEQSRLAMTAAIVHLLSGDFDTLISTDAKHLGFLPHDLDTTELQPLLKKILTQGLLESGSDLQVRKRKLLDISNELNEVFFKYPFTVPPFFALVTRGLGLLEGIALTGDPSFDIFKASYPFARRRAIEVFGAHSLNHWRRRYPTSS